MCTSSTMYYKLLICTHILQLLLYNLTTTNCVVYTQIFDYPGTQFILIPNHTHKSHKPKHTKLLQDNTQPDTSSNSNKLAVNDSKTTTPSDSTTTPSKTNQPNDSTNVTPNTDKAEKTITNNENAKDDTTSSKDSTPSTFEVVVCTLTAGYICPNSKNNSGTNDKNEDNINENEVKNPSEIVPIESKNCFEYGKAGVVSSDWVKPEELGWIVVNELGVNRFTSTKPANSSYPPNLLLDKLECNAASYEVVLKLGTNSIGGLVIRASTDKEMAVVLDTTTKTVSLLKNQNGGYQKLYEKSHQGINSQFLHKLGIIDSGYKGEVQVLLDGEVVMDVPRLYFESSGGFGLHIDKGNVSFSEVTVEPL